MAGATLTLYREKTVITALEGGTEQVLLTLKANRITLPLGNKLGRETMVIRGQNMPDTLRMASLVYAEARRSRTLLRREPPPDWRRMWDGLNLTNRSRNTAGRWIAVYGNGMPGFASSPCRFTHLFERLTQGREMTQPVLDAAAMELGQNGRRVRILHASKAGVVISMDPTQLRCAIQMRDNGQESSFSFTVPTSEKGINLGVVLEIAAHYVEGHSTVVFLDKVRGLVETRSVANSNITANEIKTVLERRRDLTRLISNFESIAPVRYRPERPMFLAS
ncbi:MAG: hypothetical protein IT565_12025 [Rhodospirillales bacterium]|nr:hypothetical protein [Rhodospirillales bacterium]